MSEHQLPLFVFGTLRRGECNHHYLQNAYSRKLPARLTGFTRVRPLMIAPAENGVVLGELYFLRLEDYQRTLAECDALEGIPPGRTEGDVYRRIAVNVETAEGRFRAWAYVEANRADRE